MEPPFLYHIAGIYYESFNFAKFAIGSVYVFAKIKANTHWWVHTSSMYFAVDIIFKNCKHFFWEQKADYSQKFLLTVNSHYTVAMGFMVLGCVLIRTWHIIWFACYLRSSNYLCCIWLARIDIPNFIHGSHFFLSLHTFHGLVWTLQFYFLTFILCIHLFV